MEAYDCDDFNKKYISLIVQSEDIAFLIVEPHDHLDKWMLRVAPRASFDRWGNSAVIQAYFNNETALLNYLENNQLDIYKALFSSLSDDYKYLSDNWDGELI
mgnify:CR=1 FL=1